MDIFGPRSFEGRILRVPLLRQTVWRGRITEHLCRRPLTAVAGVPQVPFPAVPKDVTAFADLMVSCFGARYAKDRIVLARNEVY